MWGIDILHALKSVIVMNFRAGDRNRNGLLTIDAARLIEGCLST